MRAVLGAGGIAALSAIAVAIVSPARPPVGAVTVIEPTPFAPGTPVTVLRPVQYVQLLPGQTAPPGAKVIDAGAPTPITVVTVVAAPVRKTVTVKTAQSGTVTK
jgi:hypothetical protein